MRTMTMAQAQTRYGISRTTLYRYVKAGQLTPHHIGPRLVRFDADQLNDLFHGPLVGSDAGETVTA